MAIPAAATHRVRAGAIATARPVARHQRAAGRHEDLQHELRVLPVRMDARPRPVRGSAQALAVSRADRAAVAARLRQAARDNESLDRLTVAGHGEPTLHPEFDEIVERLVEIRDRLAPDLSWRCSRIRRPRRGRACGARSASSTSAT